METAIMYFKKIALSILFVLVYMFLFFCATTFLVGFLSVGTVLFLDIGTIIIFGIILGTVAFYMIMEVSRIE